MAIEATIVEQFDELRKIQTQQQKELIKRQLKQREKLSNEQKCAYQALTLSVEEMNLNKQTIVELIKQEKGEALNLIDLDSSEEECISLGSQKNHNVSQYINIINEMDSNKILDLIDPQIQLNIRNNKINSEPCDNSYNQHNYNSQLVIDSMHSFSSQISDKQHIPLDEMPVPSPKKDFNTLLEEKLKDSEAINVQYKSKPVVRRPFLKKGQGLARFMPNSHSKRILKNVKSSNIASFSTYTQSTNSKTKVPSSERYKSLPKSQKNDISKKIFKNTPTFPQPKLSIKNLTMPRKQSHNKSVGSEINSIVEKKIPGEIISDTNSSDLEIKNKRELEEVRIFELLEDKAENSSFCSTSSTVIAFLQQSTPLKHKALLHSASKHKISPNDIEDQTLEEFVNICKSNHLEIPQFQKKIEDQKLIQWDEVPILKLTNDKTISGTILPYGTDIDMQNQEYSNNEDMSENENSLSLHVRFSEHNEYKTMTDASSISSDSETITNFIDNKETWSDCSVTSDSSNIESLCLQLKNENNNDDKNIHRLNFFQENQNNNKSELIFKNKLKNLKENQEQNEEENKIQNLKIDEIRKNEIENIENNQTLKNKNIIKKKNENASLFKSQLLKTRLLELEQEIEIFRKESAALMFQRQKLKEERAQLQEERINMQKIFKEKEETLEIEKRKMENNLQEEKKRLAREKIALENRLKDAWEKAQKSKQERYEIQILRDDLEELKEEYSKKESKWSATNARQRSQVRVLQTENSKLKQELEHIQQKKNAKLKKPIGLSNTRAIHQINKFLAEHKKISPFKPNVPLNEEELKMHNNNVDINCDLNIEMEEEKQHEKEFGKIKILKSVESIARTRNLYESLLKDATEDLKEFKIEKQNLIDQDLKYQKHLNHLNYVEENYNNESVKVHKYSFQSKTPKSFQIKKKQPHEYDSNINNELDYQKSTTNKQDIREVRHSDGHVEFWYPNGNVKKVFPDKFFTKMIYYNGDVRETNKNGTIKYFYAATRTWSTTMPDGLEILEFPDGQVERRSRNGTIEVTFPDGSVKIVEPDGSEKWTLRDGTIAETLANGEKVLTLPNGQREIHTKEHKRREYPDGTVKLIYPDGIQETRYANGRIRRKDKDGNLIMDTNN